MTEAILHLVGMESPSTDAASQGPLLDELETMLQARGFRTRRISGQRSGGQLLAVPHRRQRHRPYQLVLGHCDTVWPTGTLATMPAEVVDGQLRGPGAYDMKAGLVQILFALEALEALDLIPQVDPVIFVNSDEEITSFESKHQIVRLARSADRVFVPEPSLGPQGKLKTARKGIGRFKIAITGRAAHAGLDPEKGASAVLEMAHVIQTLFELNDLQRGISVNVGTIEGGTRANVIAAQATAMVDVRVLTSANADTIEQFILGLQATTPGTTLTVTGAMVRPPLERTPRNQVLWGRAQTAANELGIEIDQDIAGGGSDGNITSVYAATLDGLGAVGGDAHAANEHIVLDRSPERAALLARLLLDPPLADAVG
jgi:glutamate carboxypeptidase